MSAMRCCSAWKLPIGTPNCLRVRRYSSVAALAASIAPSASAQSASSRGRSRAPAPRALRPRVPSSASAASADAGERHLGGAAAVDQRIAAQRRPGASAGTRNSEMPACVIGAPEVRARYDEERRPPRPVHRRPWRRRAPSRRRRARARVPTRVEFVAGVGLRSCASAMMRAPSMNARAALAARRCRSERSRSPAISAAEQRLDHQAAAERLEDHRDVEAAAADSRRRLRRTARRSRPARRTGATCRGCSPRPTARCAAAPRSAYCSRDEAARACRPACGGLRCVRSSSVLRSSQPEDHLGDDVLWISLEPPKIDSLRLLK